METPRQRRKHAEENEDAAENPLAKTRKGEREEQRTPGGKLSRPRS